MKILQRTRDINHLQYDLILAFILDYLEVHLHVLLLGLLHSILTLILISIIFHLFCPNSTYKLIFFTLTPTNFWRFQSHSEICHLRREFYCLPQTLSLMFWKPFPQNTYIPMFENLSNTCTCNLFNI